MAELEERVGEGRKVSKGYLLGLLKEALPAHRINVGRVKRVLKLIVAQGYNAVELYREALKGRPPEWDTPPLLGEVTGGQQTPPSSSLKETAQRVADLRAEKQDQPPSKKEPD